MIVTRLRGGLGNQMFQYAAGKARAVVSGQKLALDLSWFDSPGALKPKREFDLTIFNVAATKASRLQILLAKIRGRYLDGFWQDETYFKDIQSEIRKDFSFAQPIEPGSQELATRIRTSPSVMINVRRGDFVADSKFLGTGYYERAVAEITRRVPGAVFFVFSDDMEWCRQNLTFIPNAVFVGHEHAGHKFGTYLQLMTLCRHFIIPNSTFAWWAAWLSANPQKIIIAPREWLQGEGVSTNEVVPGDWMRI